MQFVNRLNWYYLLLVVALSIVGVTTFLNGRRPGIYLRAIKEDETPARAIGINVLGWKVGAAGVSALLGAVGGSFYAHMIGVIEPTSMLGMSMMIQVLMCAIVGGVGTSFGPMLGALLLIPATQILRVYLGGSFFGVQFMVYGILLMLFTRWLPGGLASLLPRSWYQSIRPQDAQGGKVLAE